MNGAPHTHELVIIEHSSWCRIEYGDQKANPDYAVFGSREKKIERVARRLIREHDYQSAKAQERTDVTGRVAERLNSRLLLHGQARDQWGVKVIDEP